MFLEGNGFPERWPQQRQWTIAETGFGTGLNFLCCWEQWQQHRADGDRLCFVSTEKHPMPVDTMRKALAEWHELSPLANELLAQWPAAIGGFHSLSLDSGRVTLLLLFGDCIHAFSQLDANVDAWLLDGFSPSRNPDMWHPALFEQMARLSAPGATLATFTAAGFVRRGLIDAGFTMSKRQGYRFKRDMLVGVFSHFTSRSVPAPPVQKVAVIGAGLAGCSVAYALATKGIEVEIFETNHQLANAASAIPAAVTRPFPDQSLSPAARLSIDGFSYSRQLLSRFGMLDPQGALWKNNDQWPALPSQFATPMTANPFCSGPSLALAEAQSTDVAELCSALTQHRKISIRLNAEVSKLRQTPAGWDLDTGGDRLTFSDVVICSGAVKEQLLGDIRPASASLSSKPIRGQLSGYWSDAPLPQIICGNGHAARRGDRIWIGASFVPGDTSCEARERDREVYEAKVAELTGGWSTALYQQPRVDWVGIRNTTADHLPLAGQVADSEQLAKRYQRDKPRRGVDIDQQCRVKGLYVSLAHGSRGTVTAPICGEMIAAAITGGPCPLPVPVRRAIDPAREAVKSLRRQQN